MIKCKSDVFAKITLKSFNIEERSIVLLIKMHLDWHKIFFNRNETKARTRIFIYEKIIKSLLS